MSRRLASGVAALTLAMGSAVVVGAAVANADEHESPIPPHRHMLLLGATFDLGAEPPEITYDVCIDLANNRILRLNAHHEHLHFGTAGEAQRRAGHLVVPTAPAFGLPWTGCTDFAGFFPPN